MAGVGHLHQARRDGGEVRVGDVVDHADGVALAGGHGPGLEVGGIPEFGDRLADPADHLLADLARSLADYSRRGRQRDSRPVGYILQGDPARARRDARTRPGVSTGRGVQAGPGPGDAPPAAAVPVVHFSHTCSPDAHPT